MKNFLLQLLRESIKYQPKLKWDDDDDLDMIRCVNI